MNDTAIASRSGRTSIPRYREIHDALRQQIVSGTWPAGYRLPSEQELAAAYNCARMTISKALGALAERGLVTRRRRAGTTVNAARPQESVLEIHDIESEVRAAGHEYSYEALSRATRRANAADIASLGVPAATPILELVGRHCADGRPHALEERLINLAAVPAARYERFRTVSPGKWLLARVPWTEAEHVISALSADQVTARTLAIAPHAACLCIERRTWLDVRRITYVRVVYPSDQHRLIARFRPLSV